MTWVAPALVGTPLIALWIAYYKRKFAEQRSRVVVNT
jgi:hypothetical protein